MPKQSNRHLKALISYSHDSGHHKDRVLSLSDRLRSDGIDCHLDQYETSPAEGWPRWMNRQIEEADFVLVVCTQTYFERFTGSAATIGGLGAKWEGAVMTQDLYEAALYNTKFIPVIFSPDDSQFRPKVLRPATYYNVSTEDGYEDLYRRLTDQPSTLKPAIGDLKKLPPRRAFPTSHANNSAAPPVASTPATNVASKVNESLVLLMNSQRQQQLIPALKIEAEAITTIHLAPQTPHDTAFLSNLRDSYDQTVALAFGLQALIGKIEKMTQRHEGGTEVWIVTLQEDKNFPDRNGMEYSINGWSPDDIATLRARRILLNEQTEKAGRSMMDRLNGGMIEYYVSGKTDFLGEINCPFPQLYAQHGKNESHFINVAKLFAVLYLRLSQTVKHILKLELKLQNSTHLDVKFEGQRARQYSNVEPHVIKFKGTCALIDEEDEEDEET